MTPPAPRRAATLALVLAALCGIAATASAAPADDLQAAADHLQRADYARAAQIAGEIAHRGAALDDADRAEAWRVYGLALFFLDRRGESEQALLAFLRLEPDAQLDPLLVPPEAIRFFDEVRVRHADAIASSRPKRKQIYPWLNLAPPFGQFQNDESGKGWVIAGAGVALLGANVAAFLVLRDWCGNRSGDTCRTGPEDAGGEDRTDAARTLRTVNWISAAALAGVYLYGVVDGYRNMPERRGLEVSVDVRSGGTAFVVLGGSF